MSIGNERGRFAVLLKRLRTQAGMTQRQLADLSTVSVRAIRDLELDLTRSPRRETIRLLADALRLSGPRRADLERAAAPAEARDWLINELAPPPAPLTPLVGYERDVPSLTALLESGGHRLVTAVGVPGVGKTRLGQEVANRLHRNGTTPVIWLDAESRSPGEGQHLPDPLPARIRALLRGEPVLEELSQALSTMQLTLVLAGHQSDRTQHAVRTLLVRCPGLRVLAESRVVPVEPRGKLFPVFPLAAPEWRLGVAEADRSRYPALQFLLSRYEQLRPGAPVDAEITAAFAGICWFLDGVPMALEAVAAWLLLYQPVRLLDMVRRHPLRLIAGPTDTGPDLPEALRRLLSGLPPCEAEILHRLAALSRPWTLEQALERTGDASARSANRIYTLCTQGLVRPLDPAGGGDQRFTVLNLVRYLLAEDDAYAAAARRPHG